MLISVVMYSVWMFNVLGLGLDFVVMWEYCCGLFMVVWF